MGRRPKTTSQKDLTGNPGRRPLNPNEPTAVAGLPRCPTHVTGPARLIWHRLGKQLVAERRMALVYEGAFAAYCVAWGRWVTAETALAKKPDAGGGAVITSPNGHPMQSPWLAISNKAQQQMMKAISELGLSPTSSSKVSTVKHGATITRFDAFLAGKFDGK